jgi:hypothetical protein
MLAYTLGLFTTPASAEGLKPPPVFTKYVRFLPIPLTLLLPELEISVTYHYLISSAAVFTTLITSIWFANSNRVSSFWSYGTTRSRITSVKGETHAGEPTHLE